MQIKNSFDKTPGFFLATEIYETIKKDNKLTRRKFEYVQKKIREKSVFVALDRNKLIGFIFKDRLYKNYFEIKSWYVLPRFRNKGIGEELLESATKDKKNSYLLSTFDNRPLKIAEGLGFKKITYKKLSTRLLFKYLLTKNLSSMYRHFFIHKSTLLIK